MTKPRRLAALLMVATAMLGLFGTPADAAPNDVEAIVFLRSLTVPAGRDAVEDSLSFLLFADRAGWAEEVALSFDLSGVVAVADVEIAGVQDDVRCSAGPAVRCVLPGPSGF